MDKQSTVRKFFYIAFTGGYKFQEFIITSKTTCTLKYKEGSVDIQCLISIRGDEIRVVSDIIVHDRENISAWIDIGMLSAFCLLIKESKILEP